MVQPNKDNDQKLEQNVIPISRFRQVFPQVLSTIIASLQNINLGLKTSTPAIIIAALTSIRNDKNRDEFLTITALQASWIGSFPYLIQPVACLASGFITDLFGRKLAMILVNVPFAIGWFLLYQSTEVWHIFVGLLLLGIGTGLSKATTISYLGEISQPSVRGILIGYSNWNIKAGTVALYVLNQLMPWRMVALVAFSVPMTCAICLLFVPETPQWLLSKNRTKKAEKSLRWLRGWVPSEQVTDEFNNLKKHSEKSKSCNACIKQDVVCTHPLPTLTEKLSELKRKSVLKPFAIIMPVFFLSQFTGILSTKPYILQIFRAYESPIEPDQAATIISIIDNFGNLAFMFLVSFTGKRRLYLTLLTGIFLTSLVISCYGFIYLPSGYISFNQGPTRSFHLDNPNLAYIPLFCVFLWSFFSNAGLLVTPWSLLSELLPLKSRALAAGIIGSLNYILEFTGKKTYYELETTLSMPGAALFYCTVAGIGLILMYFILPETEGRTLEDIESHFSDDSKSIFNRKIAFSKANTKNATDTESSSCEKVTDLEQGKHELNVNKTDDKR